eukprot:10109950-Heterocapsa_arctica.AAC.1
MNKKEESDCRKWMDENQHFKADAMNNFDKKLLAGIAGTGRVVSSMQDTLSGLIFDTLIGGPIAKERGWLKIDMNISSCHGWIPWGTLKNFYTDAR